MEEINLQFIYFLLIVLKLGADMKLFPQILGLQKFVKNIVFPLLNGCKLINISLSHCLKICMSFSVSNDNAEC